MIGLLDELAHETNFANKFRENGWNSKGIRARDEERYAQKGMEVCQRMDIKVSESVGRADLSASLVDFRCETYTDPLFPQNISRIYLRRVLVLPMTRSDLSPTLEDECRSSPSVAVVKIRLTLLQSLSGVPIVSPLVCQLVPARSTSRKRRFLLERDLKTVVLSSSSISMVL